ncbi:MAG: hypothetical protein LBT00_02980 [Spirochaetaceae bacterium]|nr:hypothetical protein [Spirochaetaceae bacterium]
MYNRQKRITPLFVAPGNASPSSLRGAKRAQGYALLLEFRAGEARFLRNSTTER